MTFSHPEHTKQFTVFSQSLRLIFIEIEIRDADSYSDLYLLFQVFAPSNPLLINDSYQTSLSAL